MTRNLIGLALCLALGGALGFGGIIVAAGINGGHVHVKVKP